MMSRALSQPTFVVSNLPSTFTIVAIALDSALLRSLDFALQAHGYKVASFRSWKAARDSVSRAACVILDGCLPTADRNACFEMLEHGVGVVLLAEDDTSYPERSGLQVLQKPLAGSDVVAALRHYVETRSGTTEFRGSRG
jgi:DNA-binding NtrC family response regulator